MLKIIFILPKIFTTKKQMLLIPVKKSHILNVERKDRYSFRFLHKYEHCQQAIHFFKQINALRLCFFLIACSDEKNEQSLWQGNTYLSDGNSRHVREKSCKVSVIRIVCKMSTKM